MTKREGDHMQRTLRHQALSQHLHTGIAILALALFCLFICGCSTTSTGEQTPEQPVSQIVPSKLAIVHTGGMEGAYKREGRSMGLAAIKGLATQLEGEGYEVLTLDSGNSLGGSAVSNLMDGETAVGFINAAGYDAMALGKLELALGTSTLSKRFSQSDFKYLSANVLDAQSREPLTSTRFIHTLTDGRSVGVFGLTSPSGTEGLGPLASAGVTLSYTDLETIAKQQVSELKAQGCRLIVCLTCLGFDEQGLPLANHIASTVDGIDVLLDASTGDTSQRTQTSESGYDSLVIETASGLEAASVVIWEQSKLSTRTVDAQSAKKDDEQVASLVTQAYTELDRQLAKVVCISQEALPAERALTGSCGLGQLVADTILWEASRGVTKGPDAALVCASTLKASLPKGDITNAGILSVLPHTSNRLCTMEITGGRLEQALQPLFANPVQPSESMPQVSGIVYAFEQQEGDAAAGHWVIQSVGGKPFSSQDTYTVVTSESLVASGGALQSLVGDSGNLSDLGTSADKALSNYLAQECKGSMPERYLELPAEAPAEEASSS